MNDLQTAKTLLTQKHLTLIIVKNGETLFETTSHRITGFLNAIEQLGAKLEKASVADRVAGKAIALLCIYAGIRAVYTETLSKTAKEIFEKHGVTCEWKELVDNILDENKSDTCPFEKEAAAVTNPEEAYERFKVLQQKLKACR
jgi:hypothetical protein